jgi:hypothetical protein
MIFSPAKLLNAPCVATLTLNQTPSTPTFNLNGSMPVSTNIEHYMGRNWLRFSTNIS